MVSEDARVALTATQAAARVGMSASGWRSYVSMGRIPPADLPGRPARWYLSTVDAVRLPGCGWRKGVKGGWKR